MNWIKKNNKFVLPNNNIDYGLFKETLTDIDTPNESYIYIPTHNIKDAFEWYRLFNDSYVYTDNFDKKTLGIEGWFSKNRGQSIKGWFPNLYEVKASTTDTIEYYTDSSNNYFKRSIDYIDDFTNVPDLTIDGVKIEFNDIVLIKNQNFEQLILFNVNPILSYDNYYYCKILPNETKYFNISNPVILKNLNGEYVEDTIINITYHNDGFDDYIIIQTKNIHENIVELADLESGQWIYNTYDGQNGIYYYDGQNTLLPIIHMYDKYQTYNQIVYTYLGDTNQNKEFYLRRNNNKTSQYYSQFPYIGINEPLFYSEGSAYLIKCRLNYDLSIEDNSNITIDPNCCLCNLNTGDPQVEHTAGPPPFDINSTAFRLLFLDNTMAEKIFSSYDLGVGKYEIDNRIDITTIPNYFEFDINQGILKDLYYDLDSTIMNNMNNFIYQQLNTNESYEITFNNDITITQNTKNTTVLGNSITTVASTTINLDYTGTDKFPANVFNPGDYIHIQIFDDNELILDHNFVVISSTMTSTNIEVEIYQPFSKELIDTITENEVSPLVFDTLRPDISFKISSINTFGLDSSVTDLALIRNELLRVINSSLVGKIYEFVITEENNNFYLDYIKIRQNLKHKYFDLRTEINWDGTLMEIDSAIMADYRQYFYDYTIEDYLKNYLGLQSLISPNTLELEYLKDVSFTYNDAITTEQRFDISGSSKNNVIPQNVGNIITFGRDYKEIVLDDIKKHTLVEISYSSSYAPISDVFIYDVQWDEELNYGKIILTKEINIPNNNDIITFSPYRDVIEISNKLKTIFDKSISNNINNLNNNDFPDYRIQTMSYAYAFMNYAKGADINNTGYHVRDEIINNITGVFYNSYNELQAAFLKRDRNFKFPNDEIINVTAASTTNINIFSTAPTLTLDGVTINDGDIIILKDQNNPRQNGVYVRTSDGLIGGYIRYETFRKNIYWNVLNGAENTNTTFVAYFDNIFIPGESVVVFNRKNYKTKSDPRLTMSPVQLYKLGVDNDTQKPININNLYDVAETEENKVTIQPNISSQYQIRFIDGLTEYNIKNDIDGQGQYQWILDENVKTINAVVGCTKTNGPGTGKLIWYTGTWETGLWCDGIWIQGLWIDGIWLNGIRKANHIIDNYSTVNILNTTDENLSIWKTGTWYNGINELGIFEYVDWIDGTFNNGMILDGIWENGTFNNGKIYHIHWLNGNFHGGDFLTGIWENGLFKEHTPSIPATFGKGATLTNNYNTRAIWRTGTFDGGQFYSGQTNNNHKLSVWYNGNFVNGVWYGGSFISGDFNGLWKDGVWFGGYYIDSIVQTQFPYAKITVYPDQYDNVLGLTGLTDYQPNTKHNLHLYKDKFILFGDPVNSNNDVNETFVNRHHLSGGLSYVQKEYRPNTGTDTELELELSTNISNIGTTYNQPLGNPIICSNFTGTFESGTWMHGYFHFGQFQTGMWFNGMFNNGNFGLI